MKKLLACVLAVVMCMLLCVCAFGANFDSYSVLDMSNNKLDVVINAKTEETTHTFINGDKKTVTVYPAAYTVTVGEATETDLWYACDASVAKVKIVNDSKVIDFATDVDASAGVSKVVAGLIEGKKNPTCGEFAEDVYVIDGKAYEVGGSNLALLNDKMVTYGEVVNAIAHKYNVTKIVDRKAKEVTCSQCGKKFEPLTKIPADYIGDYVVVNYDGGFCYVLTPVEGLAVKTNEKLASPKTFDAGITSYIGLSLASIAGLCGCGKKRKSHISDKEWA